MRLKNQGTASGSVTSLSIVAAGHMASARATTFTRSNDSGSDHDLGARHPGAG